MATVKKVSKPRTFMLKTYAIPAMADSVKDAYQRCVDNGWQFFVADQTHGWCQAGTKTIVIPNWVADKRISNPTELEWYVSHEIAHAFNIMEGHRDEMHGPIFMAALKKICPPRSIEWELAYKPRNAKAAGIGQLLADDELV